MSALTVEALGAAAQAVEQHLSVLVEERVASRLFAQDAQLWGPDAEEEAAIRLSWVGLHRSSRPLVGEIAALREELRERGVDRIVLCGMGGSSLAPEVICATAGQPLVVLDSSDPDMVRAAVAEDLERTAVVVSSKSGSTLETDSQRRAFVQAFTDAGIDPTERIVIVTDPGSPLDSQSREAGYRVVNADPDVGGSRAPDMVLAEHAWGRLVEHFDGKRVFEAMLIAASITARRLMRVLGARRLQPQLLWMVIATVLATGAALGVDGSVPIYVYCRIGERSSHTWFVLRELLGHQNVKNYDGSWTEYGNTVGLPIANLSGTVWNGK